MMKKVRGLMSFLLVAVLLMSTVFSSSVFANNGISVEIDGERVSFSDQQPVIVDGRTLVPVRGVFEALGFLVKWESDTQTALLGNAIYTINISIGVPFFYVNGDKYTLDVPAQVINGRTMLPIRQVLEAVGCDLYWDSGRNTAMISSNGIREHGSWEAIAYWNSVENATPQPASTGQSNYETRTNAEGTVFYGIFDNETGWMVEGKMTFQSGEIQEGTFDRSTGYLISGKTIFPSGIINEGTFNNGDIVNGKTTFPSGEVTEGTFRNGNLITGTWLKNGITYRYENGIQVGTGNNSSVSSQIDNRIVGIWRNYDSGNIVSYAFTSGGDFQCVLIFASGNSATYQGSYSLDDDILAFRGKIIENAGSLPDVDLIGFYGVKFSGDYMYLTDMSGNSKIFVLHAR